METKPLGLFHL